MLYLLPMESFEVNGDDFAGRIDKFLSLKFAPHFSRTYFAHLIEEGLVLLNGAVAKKRMLVEEGDSVEVCFAEMPETDIQPENIPLDIVYEDKDIIVVNKPMGLVIHPAPGNWTGTFVNALIYHCHEVKEVGDPLRPGIVHRLDKDTTGLLVAAKHLEAQKKLIESFAKREVRKEYLAITSGKPRMGRIENLIGRDPKNRQRMAVVQEKGKNAITDVKILDFEDNLSLVHLVIETGRTHQIRVHLKYLGTPVLGDTVYGSETMNKKHDAPRPYLHAWKLQFPHPITGEPMAFEAPLAPDMRSIFPEKDPYS